MRAALLGAVTNAFFATAGAYGLSLTGFWLLRGLTGESLNSVALMNNIVHLMLLLSLPLFAVTLLARRWTATVALLMPVIIALNAYLPLFTGTPPPPPAGPTLTVLTNNIQARDSDYAGTIDVILEADADIVAVQEYWQIARRTMEPALAEAYPYVATHIGDSPVQGQALFSRYPILEDEYIVGSVPVRFGHQRTRLDIDGTEIVIYNVHPVHPLVTNLDTSLRTADVEDVLQRARAEDAPTIIMGDFNLTPFTGDYARIAADYTDAFRVVGRGLGYTFPAGGALPPLARIDYVFYDDHWTAASARVWPRSGGSDHHPIYAELVLAP